MANPFEADEGDFLVLVNSEGQCSLWPAFRDRPDGWDVAAIRGTRVSCLAWIESHWTDIRPTTGRAN